MTPTNVTRALLTVSTGAVLTLGSPMGCDRSSSSTTPAAPATEPVKPGSDVNPPPAPDETVKANPVDPGRTADRQQSESPTENTSSVDTPSPDDTAHPAATGGSSSAFIPPEVDLSNLDRLDREQVQKARQNVIQAPGSADGVADLGMHYCARGHYREAAACFRRSIELIPRASRFWYLLALSLEPVGDTKEALQAYRRAYELDDKYVPAYVNAGALLVETDADEARKLFDKAISLDPADVIANWGIGRCEESQGHHEAAALAYQKALELQPKYAVAHESLARVLKRMGKADEAATHETASKQGDKPEVSNDPIRFTMMMHLRGEREIAADALATARKGNIDEAKTLLNKCIRKGFDGPLVRESLGQILLMEGANDAAIIQFNRALRFEPNSQSAQTLLAVAQIEVGDFDAALPGLTALNENYPNNPVILNRLGFVRMKRKEYAEAETLLRKAIELQPQAGSFHFNLAQLLDETHHSADALIAVTRAAELDAGNPFVESMRGRLLMIDGRDEEAATVLRAVVKSGARIEEPYLMLANYERRHNEHAEVLSVLSAGVQNVPSSAALANELALRWVTCPVESLRDIRRAVECAQKACDMTLNNKAAYLNTLSLAQAADGHYKAAVVTLKKAIEKARAENLSPDTQQEMATRLTDYERLSETNSPATAPAP